MQAKKVKTVVFCTGKFYYDLDKVRNERKRDDIALIRLEQLFSLPEKEITETINHSNAKDIVWAQEEPRNMGAWGYLLLQLPSAVNSLCL